MNYRRGKLIYPDLCFKLNGIFFDIHNELGRFSRERQYCDILERRLSDFGIRYRREFVLGETGNRTDFIIEDKVILEIKAKPFILKEDYYQMQRYLQCTKMKLGLLINFRDRFLKPRRIVRIDTEVKNKFY